MDRHINDCDTLTYMSYIIYDVCDYKKSYNYILTSGTQFGP